MHPAGEDGFFKAKFHKQLLLGRSFPAAEEINGGHRKRQSRSRRPKWRRFLPSPENYGDGSFPRIVA
jgi:hypothetical protein